MRQNKRGEWLNIKMVHKREDGTYQYISMCTKTKADEFVSTERAEYVNEYIINVFEPRNEMKENNEKILKRDGMICYICGEPVTRETASIDHVIPRAKRSKFCYEIKNRRCCCKRCNKDKANMTLTEYVNKIEKSKQKDKTSYDYITKARLKQLKDYASSHEREFLYDELTKIGRIRKS